MYKIWLYQMKEAGKNYVLAYTNNLPLLAIGKTLKGMLHSPKGACV
jgi:hypothetical protein